MVISWGRLVKSTRQENKQKDKGERLSEVDTEKKMGRPRKEINKAEFEKLCGLMCTLVEIAGFFDCSEDTIETWCKREYNATFSETFKKYSAGGKLTLRRNMLRLSEKSASMAIFLAKNWLGMTDNVEVKADTSLMQTLIDVVNGKQTSAPMDELTQEDIEKNIL